MSYPWIVILAVVAVGVLFVLLPLVAHTFARFRAPRALRCPETGAGATVEIDAGRAAFTSAFGLPRLRARWCSLWPARRGCAEECLELPEAERPAGEKRRASG